ncbi:LPXTG cell wall anchor domain-containing protein [Streptomyces niveus]|uniref:LPXTG cell wall anchor domain-containing protein n=1 Tax=Streptomyces niveus TaxID=193462 RepID=UPI0034487070
MSHRHRLRLVVLPALVAGAMLVPVTAAVASDGKPTPSASEADKKTAADKEKEDAAKKAEAAKKASGEGISKEEAEKKAAAKDVPRGGVAAGEAPATDSGATTLVGSAAGALLLAGAGTYVVRRRSAARRGI